MEKGSITRLRNIVDRTQTSNSLYTRALACSWCLPTSHLDTGGWMDLRNAMGSPQDNSSSGRSHSKAESQCHELVAKYETSRWCPVGPEFTSTHHCRSGYARKVHRQHWASLTHANEGCVCQFSGGRQNMNGNHKVVLKESEEEKTCEAKRKKTVKKQKKLKGRGGRKEVK